MATRPTQESLVPPLVHIRRREDERFRDPTDSAMLVELLSDGTQTLAQPSRHPSGEQYEWERQEGQPAVVTAEELSRSVRHLAAATLLAKHYPAKGSRHHACLALAGALLRAGWSRDSVSTFVWAVARAAGDDEVDARVRNVETTAARLEEGHDATGPTYLGRNRG